MACSSNQKKKNEFTPKEEREKLTPKEERDKLTPKEERDILTPKEERLCSKIYQNLQSLGIPKTAAVIRYVKCVIFSQRSSGRNDVNWLNYIKPNMFATDRIMIGGFSEMWFEDWTKIAPPVISELLLQTSFENNENIRTKKLDKLFKRLENQVFHNTTMRSPSVPFMFPVAFELHWGIVVADKDCTIKWGDSFHQDVSSSKIHKITAVVKTIMTKLFPNATWNIGPQNLMKELNYSIQMDGFSCGFYVMSLVLSYALRFGDIPAFSYKGADDATKQYEISEMYRAAAVRCYFKRVEEVFAKNGELMTEGDVTRHITLTRLGIVTNSERRKGGAVSLDRPSSNEQEEVNEENRPTLVRHMPSREDIIVNFGFEIPITAHIDIIVSTKSRLEKCREHFSRKDAWVSSRIEVHNHGPLTPSPIIGKKRKTDQ